VRSHGEIPEFRRRYRYLVVVVITAVLILIGRFWQLQIVDGDHYRKQAKHYLRQLALPPVRGLISDRRGQVLARNRPAFDVYLIPKYFDGSIVERLVRELSLKPREAVELQRRLDHLQRRGIKKPWRILVDVSRDHVAHLEMHKAQIPGINVVLSSQRHYLQGNLAAHVLGYMNQIAPAELARDGKENYQPSDYVGRTGVERKFEALLRGRSGFEPIVVDYRGHRQKGELAQSLLAGRSRQEPRAGYNVVLTVDIELQRIVERALSRHPAGAAVVVEVETGRILASASHPAFDPNIWTGRLSASEARRSIDDPHRPLIDKVYQEHYFPGSIYKVVSAVAAVESRTRKWEQELKCKGWYHFGRRTFRCAHAHGKVNLHEAIVGSCNVFFFQLAEEVGMDAIAKYARLFGLGATTGIGLNGEVSGFIPTKAWYQNRKQPFRVGYTLNAAIGQGNTKTTPIQIAMLYAAIANGGTLYLPQILERVETLQGRAIRRFEKRVRRKLDISPRTLARLRDALEGVVNDRDGTAHDARIDGLSVAGKTGTAQVSRRAKDKTVWQQDHAWFAAYAPAKAPQIAVVVLIEHGGRAAKVAAPVAMKIISGYFKQLGPAERGKPSTASSELEFPRRSPTKARSW
jgi:penicillin-binding protein 2